MIQKFLHLNSTTEEVKDVVLSILNKPLTFETVINDTDRTTIALLYHENVMDVFDKTNNLDQYESILENFCLSDYIDRLIFQNQIWQLTEMSSFIKTFYNNFLIHKKMKLLPNQFRDVRFTKILTKYSTEFNNNVFVNELAYKFLLDKKDLFSFFVFMRGKEFVDMIPNISALDIARFYRYLEKYTTAYDKTNNMLSV
jgi:hypothetical protein